RGTFLEMRNVELGKTGGVFRARARVNGCNKNEQKRRCERQDAAERSFRQFEHQRTPDHRSEKGNSLGVPNATVKDFLKVLTTPRGQRLAGYFLDVPGFHLMKDNARNRSGSR